MGIVVRGHKVRNSASLSECQISCSSRLVIESVKNGRSLIGPKKILPMRQRLTGAISGASNVGRETSPSPFSVKSVERCGVTWLKSRSVYLHCQNEVAPHD